MTGSGFGTLPRREMLRLMAIVGAGAAIVPACATTTQSNKPISGGVLRVGDTSIPVSEPLDPAVTGLSHTQSFLWYDQLTWLGPDLKVQPNLASSWSSNADNTEWVFKLREGVKFHNGKALTARDVVYSFQRMLDPATGSVHATVMAALDPNRISAQDDLTVRFALKFPMSDVPDQAASPFASIVPDGTPSKSLATTPAGTGPFLFKEYVPGQRSVGTKNPNYWMRGFPKLDEVRITWVGDSATRVNGMKTGQFDLVSDLSAIDGRSLSGTSNVKVLSKKSGRFISFGLNTARHPFSDNRVRQALKLTQDRQQMLSTALLSSGSTANDQPIPPVDPLWGGLSIPSQNIDAAKALLAQAGFPNGLDVDLYTTELFPGAVNLAQLLQENARKAGIRVNLQKLDTSSFFDKVFAKLPSPVSFFTEAYNYRPGGALLTMVFSSKGAWNATGYNNPAFDKALSDAKMQTDPVLRTQMYGAVERITEDDGPQALPTFHNINEGVSTKLQNYDGPHPMGFVREYRKLALTS